MQRSLITAAVISATLLAIGRPTAAADEQESTLAHWDFNTDGNLQGWTCGGYITEAAAAGGVLRGRAAGKDPILVGPVFQIPARAAQRIEIRMKTTAGNQAQLFWTETLEGPYGGFSEKKTNLFYPNPDGQFHVYRIYPFWQAVGQIIRLRLDPPTDGLFEIDEIRIVESPTGQPTSARAWRFRSDPQGWRPLQELSAPTVRDGCLEATTQGTASILGSPTLSVPAAEAAIACIRMAVTAGESGRVYYAASNKIGWDSVSFPAPRRQPHAHLQRATPRRRPTKGSACLLGSLSERCFARRREHRIDSIGRPAQRTGRIGGDVFWPGGGRQSRRASGRGRLHAPQPRRCIGPERDDDSLGA